MKKFGRNFSSPIHFHVLIVTVTESILEKCRPKAVTTVSMAEKGQTEYDGARTFDRDETNYSRTVVDDNKQNYAFTVGLLFGSLPWANIWHKYFVKNFGPDFLSPIDFYMEASTVFGKQLARQAAEKAIAVFIRACI